MDIYRISKSEYIDDLSGTGAKLYGGRWNDKGTPLLYCAQHVSLSILEILVHFDGLTVPDHLMLLHLQLDDSLIQKFPYQKFDEIRTSKDAEFRFKDAGQRWVESQDSLALQVPSIITPREYNILINPLHPQFEMLVKVSKEDLELDVRLFG